MLRVIAEQDTVPPPEVIRDLVGDSEGSWTTLAPRPPLVDVMVDVEVLDWTGWPWSAAISCCPSRAGSPWATSKGLMPLAPGQGQGDVVGIPIGGGQAGQGGDFLEGRVDSLRSAPLRGAQGLRCGQVRPISRGNGTPAPGPQGSGRLALGPRRGEIGANVPIPPGGSGTSLTLGGRPPLADGPPHVDHLNEIPSFVQPRAARTPLPGRPAPQDLHVEAPDSEQSPRANRSAQEVGGTAPAQPAQR